MKKLFNVITLSLAFAPALHGDVVRESVDTLKQHIATADAQAFEKSCAAFLESEITAQDRKNALAMLERYAQKNKERRQDEIASNGDATTNKKVFARGIMQAVSSGILGLGSAYFAGNQIFETRLPLYESLRWTMVPNYLIALPSWLVCSLCGLDYYEEEEIKLNVKKYPDGTTTYNPRTIYHSTPISKGTALVSSAITAYLSYLGFKYGLQNIKNGWNYKEFLEQQVANLDEMIVYIEQAQRELK